MVKVKTKYVSITSVSIVPNPGEFLPTFQRARFKTVKWYGITIAKYLIYQYKEDPESFEYKTNWAQVK